MLTFSTMLCCVGGFAYITWTMDSASCNIYHFNNLNNLKNPIEYVIVILWPRGCYLI